MIPADHWHDNGDGTAWLVVPAPDINAGSGFDASDAQMLDRPCDTCGGLGWLTDEIEIDWSTKTFDGDKDCPDCSGTGRHTFTVEVAQPTPEGMYPVTDTFRCSVVPGMVLPIVDNGWEMVEHYNTGGGCILMTHHRDTKGPMTLYVRVGKPIEHATLPPAAAPGTWAVKLAVQS